MEESPDDAESARRIALLKDGAAVLTILVGLFGLVLPAVRKMGVFGSPAKAAERGGVLDGEAVPSGVVPIDPKAPPPGRGLVVRASPEVAPAEVALGRDGKVIPPRAWDTTGAATSLRPAPDALPWELEGKIVARAREEITRGVTYANGYLPVSGYPMGDIPQDRGACTDVVVRSLRAAGIDLQQLVHEDVLAVPDYYRLPQVDTNIDHRRISTMHAYLARNAMSLTTDIREKQAFRPGDIVFFSWTRCPNCKLDHVGVVSDAVGPRGHRLVLENGGPRAIEQDSLDRGSVVGHFRALARQ